LHSFPTRRSSDLARHVAHARRLPQPPRREHHALAQGAHLGARRRRSLPLGRQGRLRARLRARRRRLRGRRPLHRGPREPRPRHRRRSQTGPFPRGSGQNHHPRPRALDHSARAGRPSFFPMHRLIPACLALLVAAAPAPAAVGTLELKSGASLRGEILAERPDRVVIDLGFTVLSVPRDEVDRILAGDTDPAAVADDPTGTGNLYRDAAANQPALSVNENLARVGGAVVLVRTPVGLGSGFFVNPAGYIVTNHHVVAGDHTVTVTVLKRTDREMERVDYKNVRIVALSD